MVNSIENGPLIVDLPIKKGGFPQQTVSLPGLSEATHEMLVDIFAIHIDLL